VLSIGVSPSGKAAGFDPAIRRFESFHPNHSWSSCIGNLSVQRDRSCDVPVSHATRRNPKGSHGLRACTSKKLHMKKRLSIFDFEAADESLSHHGQISIGWIIGCPLLGMQ
jgi:hypothetical protein